MPVSKKRLALTNRGGSGLYSKLTDEERVYIDRKIQEIDEGHSTDDERFREKPKRVFGLKNNIADPLLPLIVDISDLNLDPENARIHPSVNMQAIRDSLEVYGQLKPIVVRREGMIVVAGNGTLQAARDLGWTKIAANIIDMTYVESSGYGLADNRTAELGTWDYEIVQKKEEIQRRYGGRMIGWSDDTLRAVRASQWKDDETLINLQKSGDSESSGQNSSDTESILKEFSGWSVLVKCDSEEEQIEVISEQEGKGRQCRAFTF